MVTSPPYYNAREYSQWKNLYNYLNDMYKNHISKFAYNFQPKSVIGWGLSHIMCCKYIEENAKGKASQALKSLLDQTPKIALVKRENKWKEIQINDIIINSINILVCISTFFNNTFFEYC